jgi:hypothetical protein
MGDDRHVADVGRLVHKGADLIEESASETPTSSMMVVWKSKPLHTSSTVKLHFNEALSVSKAFNTSH